MCFENVTVSGAEAVQASRMGTYTKVASVTQGERPVYQRVGSTVAYLFYWSNTSRWLIGSNYASSSAGVRSTGSAGAACPDQANGWQVFAGGAWVSTSLITVVQTAVGNAPAFVRIRSGLVPYGYSGSALRLLSASMRTRTVGSALPS